MKRSINMNRIGFLPLDSRPCNIDWIKDFASLVDADYVTIPNEHLGNLHQALTWEETKAFLLDNAPKVDYFLLSIDSFLHGGLIQSRTVKISPFEARERMSLISELKKLNPQLKVFAFDTVLRTSISTLDEESQKNWHLVNQYCQYIGKYNLYKDENDLAKIRELESIIPKNVLDYFLKSRALKHQVNLWDLELVKNGDIDLLLLLQEDSMPDGLQRIEQETLKNYIKENNLGEKAFLYNGTDEGIAVIFARCFVEDTKKEVKYYLLCPDHSYLDKTQPFEDRPFTQNLNAMTKILNLVETKEKDRADLILAINASETPLTIETSARNEPKTYPKDEKTLNFIKAINLAVKQTTPVFLLDIAIPNGGIWEMMQQIDFLKLKGYSAWNTASNATGTLLAHAYLYSITKPSEQKEKINGQILYRSIIDDCLYQDVVRPEVEKYVAKHGCNIFNFGYNEDFNKFLNDKLHGFTENIIPIKYVAYFPWNRTFEVGIRFLND